MKFPPLAAALALVLLSSCATLSDADRSVLEQHRVFRPLQERMSYRETLDVGDIVELSTRGVPPDFIIRYLRNTAHVYALTSHEVVKLREAGVRPAVIDYMLSTPSIYAVRYEEPFYHYEPYYYYHRPIVIVRDRRGRR